MKRERAEFILVFRFEEPAEINFPLLRDEVISALNVAALAGRLGSSDFIVGFDAGDEPQSTAGTCAACQAKGIAWDEPRYDGTCYECGGPL